MNDMNTEKIVKKYSLKRLIELLYADPLTFGYISDVFLFLILFKFFTDSEKENPYLLLKESPQYKELTRDVFATLAEEPTVWETLLTKFINSKKENLLQRFLKKIITTQETPNFFRHIGFNAKALSGLIEALVSVQKFSSLRSVIDKNIIPDLLAGVSPKVFILQPELLLTAIRIFSPAMLVRSMRSYFFKEINAICLIFTTMAKINCTKLTIYEKLKSFFEDCINEFMKKYRNRTINARVLLYMIRSLLNARIQVDSRKLNSLINMINTLREEEGIKNIYRKIPLRIREDVLVRLKPEYILKIVMIANSLKLKNRNNYIIIDLATPAAREYIKKAISSGEIDKDSLLDQIELYLYLLRPENLVTRTLRFLKIKPEQAELLHPERVYRKVLENPNINTIEKARLIHFLSERLIEHKLLAIPNMSKTHEIESILAKALGEKVMIPEREKQWIKFKKTIYQST